MVLTRFSAGSDGVEAQGAIEPFPKADLSVKGLDRVLAIPAQHVADFVNHRASSCSISLRIPRSATL